MEPADPSRALATDLATKLSSPSATLQTITRFDWWTDTLVSFRTTRPLHYQFKAGQYARLGLSIDGQLVWRAYSITSAPEDAYLEYLLVTVPGGGFTSALKLLVPGDTISLDRQSFGFMTADRFVDGETLWMIATGTGIGPYLSMLRTPQIWQRFGRLVLVHGVRDTAELAYADALNTMVQTPPFPQHAGRLTVLQTVTRGLHHVPLPMLTGRVTALLENGALEHAAGATIDAASARVMLCGNPAMIEDMRKLLHARGMRPCRRTLPGQFVTENYW